MSSNAVPNDLHEFISFEDPNEGRTWCFDVTFLASNWECIFGRGCQGVYGEDATELAEGCCSHGAHLSDEADRRKMERFAARLTAEQWQHKPVTTRPNLSRKGADGVRVTRLVDGACIFLNRPGFPGGPGCALHRAALEAGERPLDWKPEVCWQLPLRRNDETDSYGYVTSTIREWKRRDWGDGGQEFHWWCTESPEAFVGKTPVWVSMKEELIEMVGESVYAELADFLRNRAGSRVGTPVFLPHPAVRLRS